MKRTRRPHLSKRVRAGLSNIVHFLRHVPQEDIYGWDRGAMPEYDAMFDEIMIAVEWAERVLEWHEKKEKNS